jgi:hypothetical protein
MSSLARNNLSRRKDCHGQQQVQEEADKHRCGWIGESSVSAAVHQRKLLMDREDFPLGQLILREQDCLTISAFLTIHGNEFLFASFRRIVLPIPKNDSI